MNKTDELRTARIDSLVTPAELAQRHPVSAGVAEHVTASRRRIEKILNGEDKRLLVVIGPLLHPRSGCRNGLRKTASGAAGQVPASS